MPITVPVPAQTQASNPTATAILRGAEVPITCPSWCRKDHAAENLIYLDDLSHEGETISLPTPQFGAPDVHVLRGKLAQWPFTRTPEPYLCLEATDDGECAELQPAAALAFADQLSAHAARLRHLAATLQKEVA